MTSVVDISVVIPTHDQEARLSLVLAGLEAQTFAAARYEVIVVDDGCQDGTEAMVRTRACQCDFDLRLIGGASRGRNGARNLGIDAARGTLTVFLDADALPDPDLLRCYWQAYHTHGGKAIFSGKQYHLPELEYLQDPRDGQLMEGVEMPSIVRDLHRVRASDYCLTESMVRDDFDVIRRRGVAGSYPNAGTVQRQIHARQLLARRPRSRSGWLAFIPHNGAISTALLRLSGGFDPEIPFNEGWELAFRLQRQFDAYVQTVGASSYHLYHYHDFDTYQQVRMRYDAIDHMVTKHGEPRIRLVHFWYAQLWPDPFIPEDAVIPDLLVFDRLYDELPEVLWHEYELVLAHHPKEIPLTPAEVTYDNCA